MVRYALERFPRLCGDRPMIGMGIVDFTQVPPPVVVFLFIPSRFLEFAPARGSLDFSL